MNPTSKLLITLGTLTLGPGLGLAAADAKQFERCELLREETDIAVLKRIAFDETDPCREAALIRLLAFGVRSAQGGDNDEPH